MNYIDLIFILLIVLFFFLGWQLRGIYIAVIPIAFFVGILAANAGYNFFAAKVFKFIVKDTSRVLLSYSTSFLIASSIIVLIALSIARFFDYHKMTALDNFLGAAAMILTMAIPIYFLFLFLGEKVTMKGLHFKESLNHSMIFPYIQKFALFVVRLPILQDFLKYNIIIK